MEVQGVPFLKEKNKEQFFNSKKELKNFRLRERIFIFLKGI